MTLGTALILTTELRKSSAPGPSRTLLTAELISQAPPNGIIVLQAILQPLVLIR